MQTRSTWKLFASAGASALFMAGPLVLPGPASAAGSGGDTQPTQCEKGYVYDENTKACVKAGAGLLDDEEMFAQGRDLALAGYYQSALDILSYVRNQHDDMVLTYVGYANRKLGKVDEGIAFYHQALAINPNNLNTREYLGEGYVAAGRTDLAVGELNKLEALCGTGCDQYEQLELAIARTPERWQ